MSNLKYRLKRLENANKPLSGFYIFNLNKNESFKEGRIRVGIPSEVQDINLIGIRGGIPFEVNDPLFKHLRP